MLNSEQAKAFAQEWIAAWNSRDLNRILSHYADDFVMSSPLIVHFTGTASGQLKGKAQIEAYWRRALETIPDIRFELISVFVGADSLVIMFKGRGGRPAAEVLFFNDDGKIVRGAAHYPE